MQNKAKIFLHKIQKSILEDTLNNQKDLLDNNLLENLFIENFNIERFNIINSFNSLILLKNICHYSHTYLDMHYFINYSFNIDNPQEI